MNLHQLAPEALEPDDEPLLPDIVPLFAGIITVPFEDSDGGL